jgi:ribosomal protein L7/L12
MRPSRTGSIPALPVAAQQAATKGEIVLAIKLTREATGASLLDAKHAVDAYVHGRPNIANAASPPSAPIALPMSAVAALHNGKLIDAIKHTRTATGLGLKDSKEAVERYLDAHPAARRQFREASGSSSLGKFLLIAALVAMGAALLVQLLDAAP